MILETSRLVLRELGLSDLDFVETVFAHPEVMRYFTSMLSRDESEAWIVRQQERYAGDGHGYWMALDKPSGLPVGLAGVMQVQLDGTEEPGLGYILHRRYWGKGYATEAAAACRDYVFDTVGEAHAITLVRPENLPSLNVARRIGMKIERRTIYARYEHFVLSMTAADRIRSAF